MSNGGRDPNERPGGRTVTTEPPSGVPETTAALLHHDLKPPLRTVCATARYLLAARGLSDPARRMVGEVLATAEAMLGKIEALIAAPPVTSGSPRNDGDLCQARPATAVGETDRRDRLLVVEDDKLFRDFLAGIFCTDHDVIVAKNGDQALARAAGAQPPDLILLDVVMPDLDGFEVMRRLKADPCTRDIPVIIITGLDKEGDQVRGLDLGVADYITKPIHPAIVRARVRNHLLLAAQRKQLQVWATQDPLTGLANRRGFAAAIDSEWRQALRDRSPLSIVLIDIDHFKAYNDTYGHDGGDQTLRAVARAIVGRLRRPRDFAARHGGEEFAVILPTTEATPAAVIAAAIRDAVETLAIAHAGVSEDACVTISLGGTTVTPPTDAADPRAAIESADQALYQAKRDGRNCVRWAPHPTDPKPTETCNTRSCSPIL